MRPFSFGFLGSLAAHIALAILLLLLFRHESHAKGGGGEDGHAGSGDTAIDVTLASPAPAVTTTPADPTPAEQAAQSDESAPLHDTTPAPQRPSPIALPALPHKDSANGSNETTNGGRRPLPTRIGIGDGLVDGDSIDGQRALLPKAVVCKDPVAGKWEALKFSPIRHDWVHFVLSVHRSGDLVSGSILSHTWFGSPQDLTPPACVLGGMDMTVSMHASGRVAGDHITFGASSFTTIAAPCTMPGYSYAPDHFGGAIDASRQEFQSVNNDGYSDIDAPYVFRRTGCLDE